MNLQPCKTLIHESWLRNFLLLSTVAFRNRWSDIACISHDLYAIKRSVSYANHFVRSVVLQKQFELWRNQFYAIHISKKTYKRDKGNLPYAESFPCDVRFAGPTSLAFFFILFYAFFYGMFTLIGLIKERHFNYLYFSSSSAERSSLALTNHLRVDRRRPFRFPPRRGGQHLHSFLWRIPQVRMTIQALRIPIYFFRQMCSWRFLGLALW